jgi:hypothetical protein
LNVRTASKHAKKCTLKNLKRGYWEVDYKLDLALSDILPDDIALENLKTGKTKTLNQYVKEKVDTIPDSVIVLLTKSTEFPDTNILFSVQLAWMYDFYTISHQVKN